uniref:Endo/exonuclease/phosphatase domain-containing protein n=1 Tax=Anopheles dirus TaxID=7168 RepID=A0A182NPX2_9DIPT
MEPKARPPRVVAELPQENELANLRQLLKESQDENGKLIRTLEALQNELKEMNKTIGAIREEADRNVREARADAERREQDLKASLDHLHEERRQERDRIALGVPQFEEFLQRIELVAAGHPRVVLAGDFNAWHGAWGSTRVNKKGEELLHLETSLGLEVLNLGTTNTFVGNSVARPSIVDV